LPRSRAEALNRFGHRLTTVEIVRRLRKVHGPVHPPRDLDPLGELIFTILSQSTADANSYPAYQALTERFPNWEAVRKAPVASIAQTIRRAGLSNQKAPRIKQILNEIYLERRRLSLDHLAEMTDAEAQTYLMSFAGVGPKTAACVLLFACARPVLPVDTHVHRLARRLALIGPRVGANQSHALLQAQVADRHVLDFHVLLVRHGRTICKALRPRCKECVLLDGCPTGKELIASGLTAADDPLGTRPRQVKAPMPHVPPGKATPIKPRRSKVDR